MSDAIRAWVLHQYVSIDPETGRPRRAGASGRKFVLYIIGGAVNDQGWGVGSSIDDIAALAAQPRRTTQRHLRELQAEGILECHARPGDVHLYRVLAPFVDRRARPPRVALIADDDMRPGVATGDGVEPPALQGTPHPRPTANTVRAASVEQPPPRAAPAPPKGCVHAMPPCADCLDAWDAGRVRAAISP